MACSAAMAADAATTIADAATTAAAVDADDFLTCFKTQGELNCGRDFSPVVYYMQRYKHCAIFPIRYPIEKTRLLKKYLFKWWKM